MTSHSCPHVLGTCSLYPALWEGMDGSFHCWCSFQLSLKIQPEVQILLWVPGMGVLQLPIQVP